MEQTTINFPRFSRLATAGYQLYPGDTEEHLFEQIFSSGPWVVLGVNGIGKSTLLLLLKHLLVGPYEARQAGFAGESKRDVLSIDTRLFAVRVEDNATRASAALETFFGNARLVTRRQLDDLSLISATVTTELEETHIETEEVYQQYLGKLAKLDRFEDVVAIVDRVVFKLERRIDLLWDDAAQLEVFRSLLTPDISHKMRTVEGRIVSADSSARGIHANLTSISGKLTKDEAKERSSRSVKANLANYRGQLDKAEQELTGKLESLDKANERRLDARLYLKRAEKDVETCSGEYESVKFKALESAFANLSPNSTYLFLKIASEKVCPNCSNDVPGFSERIEQRQAENQCLVCGSSIGLSGTKPGTASGNVAKMAPHLAKKADKLYQKLEEARAERERQEKELQQISEQYDRLDRECIELSTRIDDLNRKIISLEKKLPKQDRRSRHARQKEISDLRLRMRKEQQERAKAESEYSDLLVQLEKKVEEFRDRLASQFKERARPFFGEQVRLVYAPRMRSVGQYGEKFSFPAFEVEMNSGPGYGDFVRRAGDQVSLSQREYLDIIFRMSLLEILSDVTGCSFVCDGPEGSVDAVFGDKAGVLFSEFADSESRNLIIACNVVEGGLIPKTLSKFKSREEKVSRIVNLLELARPTEVLNALRKDYENKFKQIMEYGAND